mmetsp:Transcript_88272/g.248543  ORF Transcript_88272/g.248543 Transcript_88272/m.248543 type:complete len:534 (-) Transcript_88272:4-1605(-)
MSAHGRHQSNDRKTHGMEVTGEKPAGRGPKKRIDPDEKAVANPKGNRTAVASAKSKSTDRGGAAANGASKNGNAFDDRQQRWANLFELLDRTYDGFIDNAEFVALRSIFTDFSPSLQMGFESWDSNDDGFLSRKEFYTFIEATWRVLGDRTFSKLENQLRKRAGVDKSAIAMEVETEAQWEECLPTSNDSAADPKTELENAMESGNVRLLRKQIREARTCRVDQTLIKEARMKLRILEAHQKAEEAIKSGDAGVVRIAVRELQSAGADPAVIKKAEDHIPTFAARAAVKKAAEKKDPADLSNAIQLGRKAGLEEHELDAAKALLPKLKAEQTLKWAVDRDDPKDIAAAIEDAVRHDVDPSITEHARQQMPLAAARSKFRVTLSEAIRGGDLQNVRDAVTKAPGLGFKGPELARAEDCLLRMETREEVDRSIQRRSAAQLQFAITRAKAANLDPHVIEDAERHLLGMELVSKMHAAQFGSNAEALQNVVDEARQCLQQGLAEGIPDEEFQKAERKCKSLEAIAAKFPTVVAEPA